MIPGVGQAKRGKKPSAAGGGGAVTVRSSAAAASAVDGTTVTLNVPAGTVNGDLLIAVVTWLGTGAITAPAGWTLTNNWGAGTSPKQLTYYRTAASEPASYNWTISVGGSWSGGMVALTGHDSGGVPAENIQYNPSSTSCSAPTRTASNAGAMLLYIGAASGTQTLTPPSGMTELWDVNSAAGTKSSQAAASESRAAGATGTRTGELTTAALNTGTAILIEATPTSPFTITASRNFVVPAGVTSLQIDAQGAQGKKAGVSSFVGGLGGRVQTNLAVTPGETLVLTFFEIDRPEVKQGGSATANRVVVAGAGGYKGADGFEVGGAVGTHLGGAGGAGGGTTGAAGSAGQGPSVPTPAGAGAAGTPTAGGAGGVAGSGGFGGAGAGAAGGTTPIQGTGGAGSFNAAGGRGGLGYFGGGGGGGGDTNAADTAEYGGGGGGGGSSYTNEAVCSGTVHTQGFRAGAAQVILTW